MTVRMRQPSLAFGGDAQESQPAVCRCQGSDLARFQAVREDLNLGLEGALFGVSEAREAAEKPRGQGSGKGQGLESPILARVLGRRGRGARSPRTKTGPVGTTDAAPRRPEARRACGGNKLSRSGGAGKPGCRLLP